MRVFGLGVLELMIIAAIVLLAVVPYIVILRKAGFQGFSFALLLLGMLFVPWITLFVFAFIEWPALRHAYVADERAGRTRGVDQQLTGGGSAATAALALPRPEWWRCRSPGSDCRRS